MIVYSVLKRFEKRISGDIRIYEKGSDQTFEEWPQLMRELWIDDLKAAEFISTNPQFNDIVDLPRPKILPIEEGDKVKPETSATPIARTRVSSNKNPEKSSE